MTTTEPLAFEIVGRRICLVGDIRTTADRKALRETVDATIASLSDETESLVVDVSRSAYLDVDALCTLQQIAKKLVDVGMTLTIDGANTDLRELLKLTRMDQLLGTYGTRVQEGQTA